MNALAKIPNRHRAKQMLRNHTKTVGGAWQDYNNKTTSSPLLCCLHCTNTRFLLQLYFDHFANHIRRFRLKKKLGRSTHTPIKCDRLQTPKLCIFSSNVNVWCQKEEKIIWNKPAYRLECFVCVGKSCIDG